jgi:hypothetical protein
MDRLSELLNVIEREGLARGEFRGLLHLLIGRHISLADGTEVSKGLTWRETAALLKKVRWDKDAVADLGLAPADLPPRDRQRYWYSAIAHSQIDSPEARKYADRLAQKLKKHGYQVGAAPGG